MKLYTAPELEINMFTSKERITTSIEDGTPESNEDLFGRSM